MRTPALPVLVTCTALVLTAGAAAAPALASAPAAAVVAQARAEQPLRLGSRGPAVRAWQQVLDRAVVAGIVQAPRVRADGVFGPVTRTVTRAVQARAGLRQDGIVGPRTRDAVAGLLDARPAPSGVLRAGVRGPEVVAWQRAVNRAVRLGRVDARPLAEDGVFGPGTRSATVAVQRALGLPADGVVDERTRDGLAGLLDG